jgi:hypothetical protein
LSQLFRFVALLAAGTLPGCAALGVPQRPSPPVLPLLPPSALGSAQAVSQSLNIAFGDQELDLQTAVQAGANRLTLIALGPLGQRAFTVVYDGSQVKAEIAPEAADSLPSQFPPEHVLADLELALWPLSAWQSTLAGTDWQLREPQPGLRRLRWHGALVAEVHVADPADVWHSRLWLSNFVYGYSLAINPQPQ